MPTWQFSTNNTPATGAVAMFLLKSALKAAGWTIPKSSDGTTYNSSGDQISSGASGANGMGNALAWFVAKDPAGLRSYCFQNSSSAPGDNHQWRVTYSKSVGFISGSPSATQVPSATDGKVVQGSGTDSSPGFATFMGSDGVLSYRYSCAASSTPIAVVIGATTYNVYPFFSVGFPCGGGTPNHGFVADVVNGSLSSQFDVNDTDPQIIYSGYAAGNPVFTSGLATAGNFLFWINGTTFDSTGGISDRGGFSASQAVLGIDPATGSDLGGKPLFIYQDAVSPKWVKGYTSVMALHCTGVPARTTGMAFNYSTPNDTILIGDVDFPWDGSSPVV
jgi:hypothetical protein